MNESDARLALLILYRIVRQYGTLPPSLSERIPLPKRIQPQSSQSQAAVVLIDQLRARRSA